MGRQRGGGGSFELRFPGGKWLGFVVLVKEGFLGRGKVDEGEIGGSAGRLGERLGDGGELVEEALSDASGTCCSLSAYNPVSGLKRGCSYQ